jgi:DNA polymerase III alpha subunit
MSARDVGNYGAGLVSRMCNMNKLEFMLTAGAFQQHGNNKFDLWWNLDKYKKEAKNLPNYGEHPRSNQSQRLGYEMIRTNADYNSNFKQIWSD